MLASFPRLPVSLPAMSPDLIAFLLDALPWLVLAVALGYLVGRFGCPSCRARDAADEAAPAIQDARSGKP